MAKSIRIPLAGLALTTLALAAAAQSSNAQAAPTRDYHIESQPLPAAVNDWADQAGMQVMWSAKMPGAQREAPEVAGRFSAPMALERVLQGSGLTFAFLDDQTVAIRLASAAGQSSSSPGASGGETQSASPAQAEGRGEDSKQSVREADVATDPKAETISEVVVTGTSIAGVSPASPVIRITRDQIEQAGLSTLADAIRAVPQNYSGGQNPGVYGAGTNQNITGASTANLRGLGSSSTLTLVDGQRLAPNGSGSGADLSTIPLSAIERVEILTDGASAIYGSDAIAGVVNIILRKDFHGAEVRARLGDSTRGGAAEHQYGGAVGGGWDGGSALLSFQYSDSDPLFAADRSFAGKILNPTKILPDLRSKSAFGRVRHDLNESVSAFVSGVYNDRLMKQMNAGNGYLQTTDVDSDQFSATAGVDLSLAHDWVGKVTVSKARDIADLRNVIALPGFTINVPNAYVNRLTAAEVSSNGPIATWSSRTVRLAVGGGYREESYADRRPLSSSANISGDRNARYAFAEIYMPLMPDAAARPGLRRLELTAAGRYERYSDFGSSTDPKLGLIYKPATDLTLRASWGTSFRAPSFEQLIGIHDVGVWDLATPTADGKTQYLLAQGGNPALDPETAESRSLSLEYRPESMSQLDLSASIYEIRFKDRIRLPVANTLQAIADPITYSSILTENPSSTSQAEFIADVSPGPGRFYSISAQPYSPSNVAYLVNNRIQNVATSDARGLDLSANYSWDVGAVDLSTFFSAAYIDTEEKITSTSPSRTVSGTIFNPASTRLRGGSLVGLNSWSLFVAVNYVDALDNNTSLSQRRVSSWTTVDAALTYSSAMTGLLQDIVVRVSGQNLLDRDPPFVAADSTTAIGVEYDSTNASPLGRFISVEVSKRFN